MFIVVRIAWPADVALISLSHLRMLHVEVTRQALDVASMLPDTVYHLLCEGIVHDEDIVLLGGLLPDDEIHLWIVQGHRLADPVGLEACLANLVDGWHHSCIGIDLNQSDRVHVGRHAADVEELMAQKAVEQKATKMLLKSLPGRYDHVEAHATSRLVDSQGCLCTKKVVEKLTEKSKMLKHQRNRLCTRWVPSY